MSDPVGMSFKDSASLDICKMRHWRIVELRF